MKVKKMQIIKKEKHNNRTVSVSITDKDAEGFVPKIQISNSQKSIHFNSPDAYKFSISDIVKSKEKTIAEISKIYRK